MKATDLPIYRVTYRLLERVAHVSRGFPRNYKLSLAGRLQAPHTSQPAPMAGFVVSEAMKC